MSAAKSDIIQTDVIVIGAGIVGLAAAERFSRDREVVICEQHPRFGQGASSRNSQVIHAGIYYPEGSLKSRLCAEGSAMMYEFCTAHQLPVAKTGKIIPAQTQEEIDAMHRVFKLGTVNGARDLRLLTSTERSNIEPEVRCAEALFSPHTGIFDAHEVMARLEYLASSRGTVCAYGVRATGIAHIGGAWETTTIDTAGTETTVRSDLVINAAGLSADALAQSAGIDLDVADYRQVPCKGEYFRIAGRRSGDVGSLVYPADAATSRGTIAAGVHLVLELGGSMKIGPNTLFGHNDLSVDESHAPAFFERMKPFLPWLDPDDLRVDSAGVRAMRTGEDAGVRDYVIVEESDRGLPALINCIGMESPALTSSLAIAEYVYGLV